MSAKKELKQKEKNISLGYLLRLFEEHQLESLGDIAQKYRKLERSLGYKTMRFQEYMNTAGMDSGAVALHELQELIKWKKQCERWTLDPDPAELLIRDNLGISSIMRHIGYPRDRVVFHIRGCLTVWSVNVNRCGNNELKPFVHENSQAGQKI